MSPRETDRVTINIDNMLSSSSSPPSKPSIFRVGDHLRSANPQVYDPQIIAIGPFHRNKPHLQKMQDHKLRYLKLLLQRKRESNAQSYVNEMSKLEEKARKCYAEDIDLDRDQFVQMLILDGCFVLEFLRMFQHRKFRDRDDPIFQYGYIQIQLLHDLMVFENQIPFFVLNRLFNMIKGNDGDTINYLIWPLLQNGIFRVPDLPRDLEGHHLLGIVHNVQCSSFAKILSGTDSKIDTADVINIDSAVELQEAGISFKKSVGNSLFHIEFKKKEMRIPEFEITDITESLFRNLIAYEYYLTGNPRKYVTDYVYFMRCLVHSPEDARLLRRLGIISNFLGADKMVYRVINQLGKNVIISDRYSYSNIFYEANRHCNRTYNIWMATLRRNYFHSPWSLISVFAAFFLLVLTVTQSTFAILSYRHDLSQDK